MKLPNWMKLSLAPDEVIGAHGMLRWHIIPPTKRLAIYLHKHQASDPRYLHDHPADNISIRLRGQLIEYVPEYSLTFPQMQHPVRHDRIVYFDSLGRPRERAVRLPRIRWRAAEDVHRLERFNEKPCWTLWIRFRNRRRWGYYEPSGWRRRRSKSDPLAAEST